jgi:PEGA domain-containing protein
LSSCRSDARWRRLRVSALVLLVAAATSIAANASADTPVESASPELQKARQEFLRGATLANNAQWGEALAAFEASEALRRHAVTTFNIGACERAMGNYTLARETLSRALTENDAAQGGELPQMLVTDASGYLAEIDKLLATVTVHLSPADARVAVDGRPLLVRPPRTGDAGDLPVLVAGVREPGPGEAAPAGVFRVILNPGTRIFTLSGKGFSDAVASRTVAPGSITEVDLSLDRLPATVHVTSTPTGAAVSIDDIDVGLTPLDLTRPAGSYHVLVREAGYVPYDTKVVAGAGGELILSPTLPKEKTAITQRWWFWTSAAAVVAGGILLTYALTRPAPQPPAYATGSTGWLVQPK